MKTKKPKRVHIKLKIRCKHYKGDGYYYKLKDDKLFLCEKCNKTLLHQMNQQKILEDSLKPIFDFGVGKPVKNKPFEKRKVKRITW